MKTERIKAILAEAAKLPPEKGRALVAALHTRIEARNQDTTQETAPTLSTAFLAFEKAMLLTTIDAIRAANPK